MTPFPQITGQTRIAAVIGWPVEHSLSPPMQNAAIQALGLDWAYVALPVRPAELEAAMRGARALGMVGINCTIPHKEAVIPFLDEIDDMARAIGAVNTIQIRDGELIGYNTDAYGFAATIMAEGELMLEGTTVLILGSGGAARGMAAGAAMEGAKKVILANRTRDRAEAIVREVGSAFPNTGWEVVQASEASLKNAAGRSQVIANATSLGMRPNDPLPIEAESLNPGQVVFDTVYTPPETALLKAAKSRGCICVGGLGMLARQGAKSLAIWSGLQPDEDLMLSVLIKNARSR
ncbi:shikimate dehydrogenase [Candidatus Sumerlaeota bacterium]|nr:shikimate dehydrogenase [Candidatus Sumerlaeota bacterium]